jgi:hypothetical protein
VTKANKHTGTFTRGGENAELKKENGNEKPEL